MTAQGFKLWLFSEVLGILAQVLAIVMGPIEHVKPNPNPSPTLARWGSANCILMHSRATAPRQSVLVDALAGACCNRHW